MGTSISRQHNSRSSQNNRQNSRSSRNVRVGDNAGRDQQIPQSIEQNVASSNQRPIPVQTISASKKFDVLTHIRKNSVNCLYSKNHSGRLYLQFNFDAKVECLVTLYFFSVEVLNEKYVTQYISTDTNHFPPPVQFTLSEGIDQSFPSKKWYIDITGVNEGLLNFKDKKTYPIILDIVTTIQKPLNSLDRIFETTYIIVTRKETGEAVFKPIKQKIHINGKSYELDSVYGFDNDQSSSLEEHSECVICMTNKSDTAAIPCRHLCLCNACATVIRVERDRKCPICRAGEVYIGIKRLVRINFSEEIVQT